MFTETFYCIQLLPYSDSAFAEVLDGALDALFVLARLATHPPTKLKSGFNAPKTVHSLLSRATSLTARRSSTDPSSSTLPSSKSIEIPAEVLNLPSKARLQYANRLRSLSVAFHNAAAAFLNAGKEGASVPFWRSAAESAMEGLAVWESLSDGERKEAGDDDAQAWKMVKEKHVPARWEYLGYALVKSGDRKVRPTSYIYVCPT